MQTPDPSARKPRYTNNTMILRLILFLAHAISAILMLAKAYGSFDGSGCRAEARPTSAHGDYFVDPTELSVIERRSSDMYVEAFHPTLFPLVMELVDNNSFPSSCEGATAMSRWCLAKALPDGFDYLYNMNSHIIGSSWNTIVLVAVFEWITASYALFYIDPFDSWMGYVEMWWGYHPIVVLCSVWNFVLLVVIWASRTDLNIPANNALLYTLSVFMTLFVHNFLARNRDAVDIESDAAEPEKAAIVVKQTEVVWRTDHFLRNRKRVDARYAWVPTDSNIGFHQQNYNEILDSKGFGVMPRYFEYSTTAPLLIVGLYASSVSFDLSWKYQGMWLALHACNLIGIPLHFGILNIGDTAGRYYRVALYMFFASWLALLAGLFLFTYSLRDVMLKPTSETGLPDWVLAMIWMLLIVYSMFGFVASRFYIPRLWFDPATTKYDPDDWDTFNMYLDFCSLLIKLPVAWSIWIKGSVVLCQQSSLLVC